MNTEELFYLLKEQIPDLILEGNMREATAKIERLEGTDTKYLQDLATILKAYLHFRIGKFKIAEDLLAPLDLRAWLESGSEIHAILYAMWMDVGGLIRIKTNRIDEGKEFFLNGIQLLEGRSIRCLELGNLYNDLFAAVFAEGDLKKSFELLKKAEEIYIEFNNTRRMGHVFANISTVEVARQRLEVAKMYSLKAEKIFEETKSFQDLAYIYRNLGRIALYENKVDDAFDFHRKSLEIRRVLGNPREISESLFYLIHAMVIFGKTNNDEYRAYMDELTKIVNDTDIEFIHVVWNLAKGLELKKSKSLKDKFGSAAYFRKVIESPYQNIEFNTIAYSNLLELDLLELRALPDNQLLIEEIKFFFERLAELNRTREIKELQVLLAIMRSRMALLSNDLSGAYTLLQNAKKEVGVEMDYLSALLNEEMKKMNATLLSWQESINSSKEVFQRLNHEELLNYLRIAADVTKSL
ncbi:MAG: hypothetical protein D6732_00815 [Methanobacteriota archaeon]|nr:MAG: hypothetical protein D6732_00815 [Euryarchaeota archaeon]